MKTTPDEAAAATDRSRLDALLSEHLLALAEANARLAQRQTELLLEHYFTKTNDGYAPVLVEMVLKRQVLHPGSPAVQAADGGLATPATDMHLEEQATRFQVPLLTLAPVNLLVVQSLTIELDLPPATAPAGPTVEGAAPPDGRRVAPDAPSVPDRDRVKVQVTIGALPLPLGLATTLEAFAQTIQPIVGLSRAP